MKPSSRRRALIVGEGSLAEAIAADFEMLGLTVASVKGTEQATDLLRHTSFDAVIVTVERMSDWVTCGQIAAVSESPVAVITRFLAGDRRYRDFAFMVRVAAYIRPPYTLEQLRDALVRLRAGERPIELIGHPAP